MLILINIILSIRLIKYVNKIELVKTTKNPQKIKSGKTKKIDLSNNTKELKSIISNFDNNLSSLDKVKTEVNIYDIEGVDKRLVVKKDAIELNLIKEEILNEEREKILTQFKFNLKRNFPNLNQHETEICSLIIQDFTTHEIAEKIGLAYGTTRVYKSKLRNHFNLNQQESLSSFLFGLIE